MEDNMKKFSLEEYLKNPNREVVTRDGRPVRIICTDSGVIGGQIVAIVTMANKTKMCLQFNENGSYYSYSDSESEYDLFFAPEKHEGWMNLFRDCRSGFKYAGCRLFNSEKEAKQGLPIKNDRYIATIKIEWEE